MSLTLRLLDEMNYKNVLRVMVGLASVILVTMITVVVLARMDLIQGIGLQHINQTSSNNPIKEAEQQLYNFTSSLFH